MMPSSTNSTKSKSPRRKSLPTSTSVPPSSENDATAAVTSLSPGSHDAAAALMHRLSSMKELTSSSRQNATGVPWCSLLPSPVPLTKHQLALVQIAQKALDADKNKTTTLALVGPHGRGKSAIARHLVVANNSSNNTVLWLQADTEWTLRASYIAVLREYACESSLGQQTTLQLAHHIAKLVLGRRTTATDKHWTIVYDNVGVPAEQFFHQWSIPTHHVPCRTIITTCLTQLYHDQWQQDRYQAFVVDALPDSDAKELLLQKETTRREEEKKEREKDNSYDETLLQQLLPLLQGLSLAIRMARAQWHQLGLSLPQYVETLLNYKKEYTQQNPITEENDNNLDWFWSFAIQHVWELSYNQEDYQKVLIVASLLHHEYIPLSILQPWSIVLMQLQAWSILTPLGHDYFSIPKFLQHAIRRRVSLNALCTAVEAVHGCQITANTNSTASRIKQPLADPIAFLPHLETLQANIDLLGQQQLPPDFPREDYADILLQTGLLLQRPPLTDYSRAQKYFQQGLAMLNKPPSTTNRQTVLAKALYYRLGTVMRLQGQQQEARDYSLKALQLYGYNFDSAKDQEDSKLQPTVPKNLPNDDYNVLSQLFHICGNASWKLKDLEDAKLYFEHELQVKQAWFGPDTPQERLARTLHNLGSICRECGELSAARDYCKQSLEMQRALNKPEDLELATTLNNLGALSYSLCDYTKAQEYFLQALKMKQDWYMADAAKKEEENKQEEDGVSSAKKGDPTKNKDIAETLHNLGMLADHLGDYDTARNYYQESLECKHAVYGKAPSPDLATTLTSLGLLNMNHGKYQESQDHYQEALDTQRSVYRNEGNMEIVRTLHGLGILNYHLGKIQESRQYHKEALEMQQAVERAEQANAKNTYLADPRTAHLSQIMQNLGNLSHNLGEYNEAREFYEQGLQLYSQVCANKAKDDHLQRMLGNLQNLSTASNYEAARNYYEKVLEMKYFVYGKEAKNSDLSFTLYSLALLNDNVGRYKEAQECYEKALDMLHHLYGGKKAQNGEIAGILHGLGTVSFNRGKYGRSERYFQKSLHMKEALYGGPHAENDDLATTHVSLGTLAHSVGRYDDAKSHLERALEMQQKVYSSLTENDQNIEVAVTFNSIANFYRDLSQFEKAESMYEKAHKRMGEDSSNPFLASMLTDFAEYHRLQGNYEKAEACLQRAKELQSTLYGEDAENSEMAFTLTTFGKLYASQGKHEQAQEFLERALKMQRHVFQSEEKEGETIAHGEVADTLEALGNLAHIREELELSKKYLEEAENMRDMVQGKDTNTVEKVRNLENLAIVSAELEDADSAQKFRDESDSMHDSITELVATIPLGAEQEQPATDATESASSKDVKEVMSIDQPEPTNTEPSDDEQGESSGKHASEGKSIEEEAHSSFDVVVSPAVPLAPSSEERKEAPPDTNTEDEEKSVEDECSRDANTPEQFQYSDGSSSLTADQPKETKADEIEAKEENKDSDEFGIKVDTTPAIPLNSENAVKKPAEKRKKNVSESRKKRSKEKEEKEKAKGNRQSNEAAPDGNRASKSKDKDDSKKDKKLKKEKSKRKAKSKEEKKEIAKDSQHNKKDHVAIATETEKDDVTTEARKIDEIATTGTDISSHEDEAEPKGRVDDSESSYQEQATGECSDENWSDNKKGLDTKSKKTKKNRSMKQPVEASAADDNGHSMELVQAPAPSVTSRGALTFGDEEVGTAITSRNRKAEAQGTGPVTDMPHRYPRGVDATSCGCWPFFSKR